MPLAQGPGPDLPDHGEGLGDDGTELLAPGQPLLELGGLARQPGVVETPDGGLQLVYPIDPLGQAGHLAVVGGAEHLPQQVEHGFLSGRGRRG